MKLLSMVMLVATVAATPGATCMAYGDPTCNSEQGLECCGTATPDTANASTAKEPIKVCQSLSSNHYTDPNDPSKVYTF